MPSENSINHFITQQDKNFPDKVALKFGITTTTYAGLNNKANKLANLLLSLNIKTGDKVAVAIDRSAEMVIALLAILKAGGVYVPIDPNFPVDRINYMLEDSGAVMLLASKKYNSLFTQTTNKLFVEDLAESLSAQPDTDPAVEINASHLAYILYTSGSSGKPKGVQVEHRNFINVLLSIQKKPGLTPDDIWLAVATISFDIASLEVFLPLITGATLVIADSAMVKDGQLILDTLRTEKVTVMQATPYTWRMLLATGWSEKLPVKIITGGEALPKDLAHKLLPLCSSLWNYYGPTETAIYSTGKQILATDKIITIGKPVDNTRIYILDNQLKLVPYGDEGEICIAGEGVARGYLNQPELTAKNFVEIAELNEKGKIYRTGDLGKITPDDEIEYLGRIDNQIKIRGFRIETGEIEYNIIQQPNVLNAVVLVYQDKLSNPHLIAYVVPAKPIAEHDRPAQFKTWNTGLKSKLPEYMIPTQYIVVHRLPLTPNGKIDRKMLPPPVFENDSTNYIAPATETEKTLAQIWTKYLGKEKIGITDDFFEMGGHSLAAVQIMVAIGAFTGKVLPIASLFRYPTIQKLAALLASGNEDSTWRSLVHIKPDGNKTPLYIIHGEGLNVLIFNNIAKNVDAQQPVFGLQSYGLNGVDDPPETIEALASAYIAEIVEQNPTGPYALAGYSFGGYVAIEMARQLQAMGQDVKMLAMFDANFKKPSSQISLPLLLGQKAIRQVRKAAFIAGSLIKQPAVALWYQGFRLKQRLQAIGLFKEENPENIPAYMQKIVDKLRAAVDKYKMTPYNGIIHIFRSKVRVYYIDDPKHLGWGPFALKGIKVHDVPGDHRDMLLPPNDVAFAKVLQDCLDSLD
jgi:amino acid adenylation domain-containing protein